MRILTRLALTVTIIFSVALLRRERFLSEVIGVRFLELVDLKLLCSQRDFSLLLLYELLNEMSHVLLRAL